MAPTTLENIPLFSSLPVDEIDHLKQTLHSFEIPAGRVLFHEGHSDDRFYILLDGQVEIVKSLGKEEERVLGVRESGTLLGEMSLFSREGCHTASVRSLTPLFLLQVSHAELDALLQRQPRLAYELIRLFSHRLEESENVTIVDLKEKNQRLRQAYDELKDAQLQIIEKEKLEKELQIAAQIQQSILPESLPACTEYDMGAMMIPARRVGGDFYSLFQMSGNRLGIVVGDVSDKGVPAALFMALSYSLVRAEAARTSSPVNALKKVNELLLQMNSSNMFVTLVYGILDCKTGQFHYARAAHPAPILIDSNSEPVNIPLGPGQPLGLFDEIPVDEQTIQLPEGGTLLLFSDGLNETADLEGNEFGYSRIRKTLASCLDSSAQEICVSLWDTVQSFGEGLPQQDDFTTVVVKRRNAPLE